MLARLHDPLLALVSVGLVALILHVARRAQRREHPLSHFVFRKLLHALIGAVTLLMTALFHSRGWAIVPPALFIALNASPKLRALVPGLADDAGEALGLWMFPLGVSLTYLFFWDFSHRGAVLSGIAALAFADPVAALVGIHLGQRRYTRWAHGRTVEGSLAFLLVTALVATLFAAAIPGGNPALGVGVGCGIAGAVAESLSPVGFDNVSVPLVVAAAYRFLA